MDLKLSQPTLGLLRKNLEAMESAAGVITPSDRRTFWKNELFDFGFAPAVVDVAITYQFLWSDIIPDLFLGKFGTQNEHFSNALPDYVCEQTLRRLIALALASSKNTLLANQLRDALKSDGLDTKPAVDGPVPVEIAALPSKEPLIADIQKRLDSHELAAIMFLDLDGFKQVNDKLGHDEGDNCLKTIVDIISEAIASKGRLYRPGGDEFVVVFPNFDRHEAAATAERIRAAIETNKPGGKLKVTASIGVTDSESRAAADATALYKIADAAMYAAKEQKNRVVVDDGIDPTRARTPDVMSSAVFDETDDLYTGGRVDVSEPILSVANGVLCNHAHQILEDMIIGYGYADSPNWTAGSWQRSATYFKVALVPAERKWTRLDVPAENKFVALIHAYYRRVKSNIGGVARDASNRSADFYEYRWYHNNLAYEGRWRITNQLDVAHATQVNHENEWSLVDVVIYTILLLKLGAKWWKVSNYLGGGILSAELNVRGLQLRRGKQDQFPPLFNPGEGDCGMRSDVLVEHAQRSESQAYTQINSATILNDIPRIVTAVMNPLLRSLGHAVRLAEFEHNVRMIAEGQSLKDI